MNRADWIDLATERAAIMEFEAGMTRLMAKAKSITDTTKQFGSCPK